MTILKNTLIFSAAGFLTDDLNALIEDTHALPQDKTVAVGVAPTRRVADYLLLEGAISRLANIPKTSFSLSKSKTADLAGWFAPRVAAKIMRHWFLHPA